MNSRLFSIKTKLILLCLSFLIIPTIAIGISTFKVATTQLDIVGEDQLHKSTNMAIGMINLLNSEVKAGRLSLYEAQEKFRTEILGKKSALTGTRKLNVEYEFGNSGYIWAIDDKGLVVMSPVNEGKNVYNSQSKDGKLFAQEALKLGKQGGLLHYTWDNLKTGNVEKTVAYAEKDKNWGWTIITSASMEEFNSGSQQIIFVVSMVFVVALIIGLIATYLIAHRMSKPIIDISYSLHKVAEGDLSGEPLHIHSNDEIGALTADFNHMKERIQNILSGVSQSTELVASSAEQLYASAEETTKATEEITNAIQAIANSSEENTNSLTHSYSALKSNDCYSKFSRKYKRAIHN